MAGGFGSSREKSTAEARWRRIVNILGSTSPQRVMQGWQDETILAHWVLRTFCHTPSTNRSLNVTTFRMFAALLALAALLLTSSLTMAQPPGGRGRPSYDTLLEAFDANDDGRLSEDEVPACVWRRLCQADANDDGVVTRREFENFQPGR